MLITHSEADLGEHLDPIEVHKADAGQVQDEGVEGHGLGVQGRGPVGGSAVRSLVLQAPVTEVEVDIAGGGGIPFGVEVVLQLKL